MSIDEEANWNLKRVSYDVKKYAWDSYWLDVAKDKFQHIDKLENIHNILSSSQIIELLKHCNHISKFSDEFRTKVIDFACDVALPNLDSDEFLIQRGPCIRLVQPDQEKLGQLLSFHVDKHGGKGPGTRAIWTPLTPAYGSNSIQVIPRQKSYEVLNFCLENKFSHEQIQNECKKHITAIDMLPGECLLFLNDHLHGNIVNCTDITRWSMDLRVLPKGGDYAQQPPGGYFVDLRYSQKLPKNTNSKTWVCFRGWNSEYMKHLSVGIQGVICEKYCRENNIIVQDNQVEMSEGKFSNFTNFLANRIVDSIVLPTIYFLPDDPSEAQYLLELALENNIELHFAMEEIILQSHIDLDIILNLLEYYRLGKRAV